MAARVPMQVRHLQCPHCSSYETVKLPVDWQEKVERGFSVPVIGCGNPWHYEGLTPQWKWLESTFKLQTETYEYPLEFFATGAEADPTTTEATKMLAQYISWNSFAAFQELAEMNVEFSWKPWAVDKPFVNRQRILDEVVDINHFLGNILTGMGVTDEEYEEAYKRKQNKNMQRANSGTYSAKKGGLGEGSDL